MQAMSEFDPTRRAMVHDTLTGQDFARSPSGLTTIANIGYWKVVG